MKWFTCTPVDFSGGEDFFCRDSGLLSRGFRSIGVESMAVMPGIRRADDGDGPIRCEYPQLHDPKWWESHQVDGVVLYAWGRPSYAPIAEAIRQSGAKLVLNQDSGGLVSPLCGFRPWLKEQFILSGAGCSRFGLARSLARVFKGLTHGLMVVDPGRARHFRAGHLIAAVSPEAAAHYRRLCSQYGDEELMERVRMIPHPVDPCFRYLSGPKEERIISVGRWEDRIQKRPDRLIAVATTVLAERSGTYFDIVGTPCGVLQGWHRSLPEKQRMRVILHGRIPSAILAQLMARAMVGYCPSAFESFHIASGEALCCGASIVAGDSPSLSAFRWFTMDGAGTLADSPSPEAHSHAVLAELDAWCAGERDATSISETWCRVLHAPEVARTILHNIAE